MAATRNEVSFNRARNVWEGKINGTTVMTGDILEDFYANFTALVINNKGSLHVYNIDGDIVFYESAAFRSANSMVSTLN